jgi:RNA polymerase sigma-70 factor (ECF subfamily)
MNDFSRALEKAIPRLRRYTRALTHDVFRADDLVQDTLVRAVAQQHRWQHSSNLLAWLFTIMHNQNVNCVWRSGRKGIAVEFGDNWPFLTAATDPAGRLVLRDLDRALARISEEQRRVMLLIGLEGTSYEEAATILDVPVGTIRSRVLRGREALRKLMDRRPEREVPRGVAITSPVSKGRRFASQGQPISEFFAGVDLIVAVATFRFPLPFAGRRRAGSRPVLTQHLAGRIRQKSPPVDTLVDWVARSG